MDYQFDKIYDYVTIESNVLHQSEFYFQRLSRMNILYSLLKRGGLKINFEIVISILCFRRCPQQVGLCPLHSDVECFDYDG